MAEAGNSDGSVYGGCARSGRSARFGLMHKQAIDSRGLANNWDDGWYQRLQVHWLVKVS